MAKANVIESFLVSLGFEVNTAGLSQMTREIEAAKGGMLSLVNVTKLAAGAFAGFVALTARSIDNLGDFAERENVAIETVQELGFAASVTGSSVDAVKNSISGLNRVIGEAALGVGRGAQTFQKLGLSAKNADGTVKSIDELLDILITKFETLSQQEAIAMAEKLGVDRSLVPLLQKGTEGIAELRKEAQLLGVVTADQAKTAGEASDEMRRFFTLISAIKDDLALAFMPTLTATVKVVKEWIIQNRKLINSGIQVFFKVISALLEVTVDWLSRIITKGVEFLKWLFQFKLAVWLAAGALAAFISIRVAQYFGVLAVALGTAIRALVAFNFAALVIPALIGAIIIAIGLLIDDFVVWQEGGESVIGELLEGFPKVAAVIMTVAKAVSTTITLFADLFKAAFDFAAFMAGAVLDGISVVTNQISIFADRVSVFLNLLKEVFGKVAEFAGVSGVFGGGVATAGLPIMNASPLTGGAAEQVNSLSPGGGVLGSAETSNINSASTVSNKTTNVTGNTIQVYSSDPTQAGKSVMQEIERLSTKATRNTQGEVVL